TARILVGEAPAEGASSAQKDLAELRASIARAGSEAAEKKLLAAIGGDLHAALVLSVTMSAGHANARIFDVASGRFTGTEIGPTTSTEGQTVVYAWPSATETVHGILIPLAPRPTPAPRATTEKGDDASGFGVKTSIKSPWFWAGLGVITSIGVS